jgi:hypothetical protein
MEEFVNYQPAKKRSRSSFDDEDSSECGEEEDDY